MEKEMFRMHKRYLTRQQAADYLSERGLQIAKNTLQKYATTGGGPEYCIFGNRALHTPQSLDQWAVSAARKLNLPEPIDGGRAND
jgi:hypothetical protein